MALNQEWKDGLSHPFKWLFEPTPKATPDNPLQENPDGTVPRSELFSIGLGLTGQNFLYNMAGSQWFFYFLTDVLKIPPKTVGTFTGIITVYDACNDPIAGGIMDTMRFKSGEKIRPWIKYTSPMVAILAFLLFVNWGFASNTQAIVYTIVVYLLWDSFYSFQDAALWSVNTIISPRSDQRTRAVQWSDIGAWVGSLIPGLLTPMLSGGGVGNFNRQQIFFVFALVLCLGGGFVCLSALRIKERVPQPPKSESLFKAISSVRHNYILIIFIVSDILDKFSPRIDQYYLFQDVEYQNWIGGDTIRATTLLFALGIVSGLPGVACKFFARQIAEKLGGMKNILIITKILGIVSKVIMWTISYTTWQRLLLGYFFNMLAETPNAINGMAKRSLVADSIDYVEWKTGERTEGMTMSLQNFLSKLGGSFDRFIWGWSLDWLQYDPNAVEEQRPQNEHFQTHAWTFIRLWPALGQVFSLIPLLLLKVPDIPTISKDLAKRRAERALQENAETAETSLEFAGAKSMAEREKELEDQMKK
ncbi:MAG: MFS transporter [Oscillospiraceae bacterium]|nr:MFS transporter [Oscillospiraceae bacterium]